MVLSILFTACSPVETKSPPDYIVIPTDEPYIAETTIDESDQPDEEESAVSTDPYIIEKLVGSWVLDFDKTEKLNGEKLWETFRDGIYKGTLMEFSENEVFTYNISGFQGNGNYVVTGDKIVTNVSSFNESQDYEWIIEVHSTDDNTMYLIMHSILDSYWGEFFDYSLAWIKEPARVEGQSPYGEYHINLYFETASLNNEGENIITADFLEPYIFVDEFVRG